MIVILPFSECTSERYSLRKAIKQTDFQILVETSFIAWSRVETLPECANVSFVTTTAPPPMIFVRRIMPAASLRLQQAAGPLFSPTILLRMRLKICVSSASRL